MVARRYQDLIAFQTGTTFKRTLFRLVLASPGARSDLKFRSQILEAARSVPANIAEGFRRYSPGDFARFLDFSLASLAEAEERLADGIDLAYFRKDDCAEAFVLAKRCLTASIRLKHTQLRYLQERRKQSRKRGS